MMFSAKRRFFITVTVLQLVTMPVRAQSDTNIMADTLIETLLNEDPTIQISEANAQQASARVGSAQSKFIPKISVSASEAKQDSSSSATNGNTSDQTGVTTKATASMNLFNGFQDRNLMQQRSAELKKAKADVTATSFSQKDKVIASVYRILSIQKDIENIEEKIRIERDREKDLKKRVGSQSTRLSDLLAVQSSLTGSANDLQLSKTDLTGEWNNLSSISGKNLTIVKVIQPKFELAKVSRKISTDALPEVNASKLDFESSEYSYKSSRGGLLPSLDVSYNQYFQRPESQRNTQWDMAVTLSLSIPIDGERTSAISEARALTHQKEITYRNKQVQESLKSDKLISDYNLDIDRYQILNDAVEIQAKLVNAFKKDYQAGLVSISDYLNSVTNLIQKRQERDRLLIQQHQRFIQIQNRILATGEKI